MRLAKFSFFVLILAVVSVLAACGGDDSASAPLSQQVSTADGRLAIQYPEGWVAQPGSSTSILLANSQDAIAIARSQQRSVPRGGQVYGNVVYLTREDVAALGAAEGAGVTDILNAYMTVLGTNGFNLGAPQAITLNDRSAAISTGRIEGDNQTASGLIIIVELEQGYAGLAFLMAEGRLRDYQDDIEAIAGTAVYTPPAS